MYLKWEKKNRNSLFFCYFFWKSQSTISSSIFVSLNVSSFLFFRQKSFWRWTCIVNCVLYKLKRAKSKEFNWLEESISHELYVPLVTRSLIVNCLTIVLHQQSMPCALRRLMLTHPPKKRRRRENEQEVIPSWISLNLIEWYRAKWTIALATATVSATIAQKSREKKKEKKPPQQHFYRLIYRKVLLSMEKSIRSISNTCAHIGYRFCELNCMTGHAMHKWWLKMIQWIACYFRNNYQLAVSEQKYFKLLNNLLSII